MRKSALLGKSRSFGANHYVPSARQRNHPTLLDAASVARCSKCRVEKAYTNFYFSQNKQTKELKRASQCIPCHQESAKERNGRFGHLKDLLPRFYGIMLDDFHRMRVNQNYRCGICGVHEDDLIGRKNRNDRRLQIDHCHDSGVVRGLLCGDCNVAAGRLKDNPARALAAFLYLQSWSERKPK